MIQRLWVDRVTVMNGRRVVVREWTDAWRKLLKRTGEGLMLVKLVWPDGRIEEVEHASVKPTTTVIERPGDGTLDADVVTSVGVPVHRFRRIHVGNVDTGDIHTLWVHADTDVQVVKRVVDAIAGEPL
jgi:hypothetical protein